MPPIDTAHHPPGGIVAGSLYVDLLEAVLAHPMEWRDLSRPPDPLAELGRIRRALQEHLYRADPGWALQAVADQLAYDSALIRLARREGIEPSPVTFSIPNDGRVLLAEALERCGISLPPVEVPFQHPLGAPQHDGNGHDGNGHGAGSHDGDGGGASGLGPFTPGASAGASLDGNGPHPGGADRAGGEAEEGGSPR